MKITAIVPGDDFTTIDSVGFATEPPLTEEVLSKMDRDSLGTLRFSLKNGVLVVHSKSLLHHVTKDFVGEIERLLNLAGARYEADLQTANRSKLEVLNAYLEKTGLPVQGPGADRS